MSVNFSTFTNSSLSSEQVDCAYSVLNFSIGISIYTTRVLLLLPLSTFILYLGAQRWREKRSFATESHSDIITYHVVILELFWVLILVGYYHDNYKGKKSDIGRMALLLLSINWYGESFFHILTCVERYLAVVHPITYRLEKNGRGVMIRNVSIVVTWLLAVLFTIIIDTYSSSSTVMVMCCLLTAVVVVSFCSLSALCVLNRPGPGEREKNKTQVDQTKQRAFFTMLAVTGALWLWFLGLLASYVFYFTPLLSLNDKCVAVTSTTWSALPSSLVLPLLYLQRAGKLKFCFKIKFGRHVQETGGRA